MSCHDSHECYIRLIITEPEGRRSVGDVIIHICIMYVLEYIQMYTEGCVAIATQLQMDLNGGRAMPERELDYHQSV